MCFRMKLKIHLSFVNLLKRNKAVDIMAMMNEFLCSNDTSWDLVEAICTDGSAVFEKK